MSSSSHVSSALLHRSPGSRCGVVGFVLLGLLLTSTTASADSDAQQWLQRMNHALQHLSYRGYFVFSRGNRMGALMIERGNLDSGGVERLVNLDGPARELVRDRNLVSWRRLQGDKTIRSKQWRTERGLSPLAPIRVEKLQQHYRIELRGSTRIAGRPAVRIAIVPRDRLRFGYRLALDKEYALPLRSRLVDADGKTLSQVLFIKLEVDPALVIDHPVVAKVKPGAGAAYQRDLVPPKWHFSALPEGFSLDVLRRASRKRPGRPVEHFVLTDGLATISVYVDSRRDRSMPKHTRVGATHAVTVQLGEYQVTALGVVPVSTLQAVLQGLKPGG